MALIMASSPSANACSRTAAYHGDRITSVHSGNEGPGCIAIGNIIRTTGVTRAMVDAFGADPQLHLAERLVRSMEGKREIGRFSPNFWLDRLGDNIARGNLDSPDAALLARVVAGLRAMAPGLSGGPVPRGPVHGDFSSQNMFWDATTGLHVFDVQSQWIAPMSIDLTWLLGDLTYKTLRDDPATPLDRGLVLALRHAAMAVPGLDHPDDPGGFMDFMTGLRHATVLLGKLDHPLGPFVRKAIGDWLNRFGA